MSNERPYRVEASFLVNIVDKNNTVHYGITVLHQVVRADVISIDDAHATLDRVVQLLNDATHSTDPM